MQVVQDYNPSHSEPPAMQTAVPSALTAQTNGSGPNLQNQRPTVSSIYTATYSGTAVLEMMVGDIAVMRRQTDSYLNATQILKVAGIEKGRRTKVLDKEILTGEHEKVQGGYGKYQGTWIPFKRGLDFAKQYNVAEILRPLLEVDTNSQNFDTKEQALAARRKKAYRESPAIHSIGRKVHPNTVKQRSFQNQSFSEQTPGHNRIYSTPMTEPIARAGFVHGRMEYSEPLGYGSVPNKRGRTESLESRVESRFGNGLISLHDDFKRPIVLEPLDKSSARNYSKSKDILTSIWLDGTSADQIPRVLESISIQDLDIDVPIDDIGCSALHWASVLAKLPLVKLFVEKGANPLRGNNRAETPLMRAVTVTNNFEQEVFTELLEQLSPSIAAVDHLNRSVLHHIALTAGIKGRASASRYYLECILERIVCGKGSEKDGGLNLARFVTAVVDVQDKQGDTALNIAARVGNKAIVKQLLEIGANPRLPNKAGLKALDFGIFPDYLSSIAANRKQTFMHFPAQSQPTRKSSEIISSIRDLISSLDKDFQEEIAQQNRRINNTHAQLREVTKKLADNRRMIESANQEDNILANLQQRTRNIERAIEEEEIKFQERSGSTTARALENTQIDADAPFVVLPAGSDIHDMGQQQQQPQFQHLPPSVLKARIWAYQRNEEMLLQLAKDLQGRSLDLENRCRRVIAMCCGVDVSRVDSLLEGLLQAVESDENQGDVDMSRIAGFLKLVKEKSDN